jgi:hypothetical protein
MTILAALAVVDMSFQIEAMVQGKAAAPVA